MNHIWNQLLQRMDYDNRDLKESYDVSYELNQIKLIRLADGRYALGYYVNVKMPVDESDLDLTFTSHYVVILGEP